MAAISSPTEKRVTFIFVLLFVLFFPQSLFITHVITEWQTLQQHLNQVNLRLFIPTNE